MRRSLLLLLFCLWPLAARAAPLCGDRAIAFLAGNHFVPREVGDANGAEIVLATDAEDDWALVVVLKEPAGLCVLATGQFWRPFDTRTAAR